MKDNRTRRVLALLLTFALCLCTPIAQAETAQAADVAPEALLAELPPLEVLYAAVVDNFIKTAPPQLAKRLEQLIKVNAEQQKARENEARKIEEAKSPLPGM